jgi:hypothetical protein
LPFSVISTVSSAETLSTRPETRSSQTEETSNQSPTDHAGATEDLPREKRERDDEGEFEDMTSCAKEEEKGKIKTG